MRTDRARYASIADRMHGTLAGRAFCGGRQRFDEDGRLRRDDGDDDLGEYERSCMEARDARLTGTSTTAKPAQATTTNGTRRVVGRPPPAAKAPEAKANGSAPVNGHAAKPVVADPIVVLTPSAIVEPTPAPPIEPEPARFTAVPELEPIAETPWWLDEIENDEPIVELQPEPTPPKAMFREEPARREERPEPRRFEPTYTPSVPTKHGPSKKDRRMAKHRKYLLRELASFPSAVFGKVTDNYGVERWLTKSGLEKDIKAAESKKNFKLVREDLEALGAKRSVMDREATRAKPATTPA